MKNCSAWLSFCLVAIAASTLPIYKSSAADNCVNVSIHPKVEKQIIANWGFDIKGVSGYIVTPGYAQRLFVTDQMNVLRLPIFGNKSSPAHPSPGVVIGSYYAPSLYAMTNARAANSNVIFFASKKLQGRDSFPLWVEKSQGVIASKYAIMLADYLGFMAKNGFMIDVLGIDNEERYNKANINPFVYNDVIDDLKLLAPKYGFTMPKLLVAPENFYPDTNWLAILVHRGWGTNLDIIGTHYYPSFRPVKSLQTLIAIGSTREAWNTEVHWAKDSGDFISDAVKTLETLFDCTDTGLNGYVWWNYSLHGLQGEIEESFTKSTAGGRPLGTLISVTTKTEPTFRVYLNGTNMVIWALNGSAKAYQECRFDIDQGSFIGPIAYKQWKSDRSTNGSTHLSSRTSFLLNIEPYTITEILVKYEAL